MRILVVDDDPVSRLIVEAAVEALGHTCVCAQGGEEGWRLFLQVKPDVVISDWVMPDLDGLSLSRRIRAAEQQSYCSIVMITAMEDASQVREAILAGADDYMTKPLNVDELGMRLIAAERLKRLHGQLAEQKLVLENLNEELKQTARADQLTGLGNRLRLEEDLRQLFARMDRYGTRCCAALLDLDAFKKYNDMYGHLMGDGALRTVAGAVAGLLRAGDAAYRYGGEELLCLLAEQDLVEAAAAIERIRRGVEELRIPHLGNPPLNVVTLSAGVCEIVAPDPDRPVAILEAADRALYRAKAGGRNRVEVEGTADTGL